MSKRAPRKQTTAQRLAQRAKSNGGFLPPVKGKLAEMAMLTPCDNCPFRKEGGIRVNPERARDILTNPSYTGFPCHKSVDYSSDPHAGETEDARPHQPGEIQCAGNLIMREKTNRRTQLMQVMERVGAYDPVRLMANTKTVSEVFDSVEQMIERQSK